MSAPPRALALLGALCACGGVQHPEAQVGDCLPAADTAATIDLHLGQRASVRPPCPTRGTAYFDGPLEITATEPGLHVRFRVHDADVLPDARGAGGEYVPRDAAVAFAGGETMARSAIRLSATTNAPGHGPGYLVDDTLRWRAFGLASADGSLRVEIAIIDQRPGGGSAVVRKVLDVRVRSRP